MWTQSLSLAFTLFILMDSIGNLPIFLALLKDIQPRRQRAIIFRELIIALVIILAFYFVGNFILSAIGVTEKTIYISGGIILFILALRMIFPIAKDPDTEKSKDKEPFIVPMAVPLVAGPAVLAAVMLYARKEQGSMVVLFAIIFAWLGSTIILICSSALQRIFGKRGLVALERLMGLILTLIAIEMFLKGVQLFMQSSEP